MEQHIEERLKAAISPLDALSVVCTDPSSGKYAVTVVSAAFAGKNLLARHRAVNAAVGMQEADVASRIHALEINARTPEEASK